MAKRKAIKKSTSGPGLALDLLEVFDQAFEQVTGKRLASWFKELQYSGETQRIEADTPGPFSDPYAILGLPPTAGLKEVKDRYKKLAAILHPDIPGGNEEAMKRLNAAYEEITKGRKAK